METNQIIFSGVSAQELVELFRPILKEEVKSIVDSKEEALLSPAETCKVFVPSITKATLNTWTKKGMIQEHRIGGRVFYKRSEIIEKSIKLKKYKSVQMHNFSL
jgi:hypothetical protein